MAFLKKCEAIVTVTKCASCGENAIFSNGGKWYCEKCLEENEKEDQQKTEE